MTDAIPLPRGIFRVKLRHRKWGHRYWAGLVVTEREGDPPVYWSIGAAIGGWHVDLDQIVIWAKRKRTGYYTMGGTEKDWAATKTTAKERAVYEWLTRYKKEILGDRRPVFAERAQRSRRA